MITLLSDFGQKDVYVAIMKGVIASIAPDIVTCDLTHEIPPQNILAARFNLLLACQYFPADTVHLAVVDPGVGSHRRAIALQTPLGTFVGPDNGLFSGILESTVVFTAVSLTNPDFWRSPAPSHTFHGRDIFAPVAAHLALGVPLDQLGDRIDPATLITCPLPPYRSNTRQLPTAPLVATGCVQYIDHFGNLITNIPAEALPTTA